MPVQKTKITAKPGKQLQKITPFLWFDDEAKEAANFYVSVFKNSNIVSVARYGDAGAKISGRAKGSVMTVEFEILGQKFAALNGGPLFKFTPAISFFVHCKTEQGIDELFKKFSHKGEILMPLDKYPFSEKYAFLKDKFGVAWQLMLSTEQPHIAPCLLFVGKDLGKAEEAVRFYTKVFRHASVRHILHYEKGENGKAGTVKHSSFLLEGQEFTAMDGTGPHAFAFNESISFVVSCKAQDEVDYYWETLSKGGQKGQCGWLKDKYGVSWQIIPVILGNMLQDKNVRKPEKVMKALLQMKKLDIKTLKQTYNSTKIKKSQSQQAVGIF